MKMLPIRDVDHLDGMPLDESEMHGRTGKYLGNCRAVRKTLNDVVFLMG
jgi:hypothetical protein